MTTVLGAGASLMIRAGAYALVALGLLLVVAAAAMAQDTISVIPTGPAPVPDVPTITLWRDAMIAVALVVVVGLLIWKMATLDALVERASQFHGLAAALMEDELIKRGIVQKAASSTPAPQPTLEPLEDPWAAEADKVAPPPSPMPAPRRVTPSTKAVAQTFSARRPRGEKVQ